MVFILLLIIYYIDNEYCQNYIGWMNCTSPQQKNNQSVWVDDAEKIE